MRIAVKALVTADTPDEAVARLIAGEHTATAEEHVPRNVGNTTSVVADQ